VLQTGTKGLGPGYALRRPRGDSPVPAGNRAETKGCSPDLQIGTKGPYRPGLEALSPLVYEINTMVD
jgi:hypothetical protein